MPAYRRVLVKLSGEALMGPDTFGLHQATLRTLGRDIAAARALGVEIGIVVGGGNLVRGSAVEGGALDRAAADRIGMLATTMNALALQSAIAAAGCEARTLSAVAMPQVCETYERDHAMRLLAEGNVVVFAGGTGNPFFTTDTTAVLRGAEIGADAVFKATQVDGVYSADPKKDPRATRFDALSHDEAIDRGLAVMDATAFTLARERRMPIIVFSIHEPGALAAVLSGTGRFTRVG